MEILKVKDLTFYYPEEEKPAVSSASFTVNQGDFFVLCGRSGCGKTTLLRLFKPQIAPHGQKSGEIWFDGEPIDNADYKKTTADIGYVLQNPDNQIVTDKVWHELAFGLESLGCDTPTIRRRVAEMASFFGIQGWFYKNVSELSGGQKQLLNLASVMVMQPKVLILDEPTSQLDPIAASDFLGALKKINRELGTTVILSEHRLEEALPLASSAAVMDRGRIMCVGGADDIGRYLRENDANMFTAMPAAMQIWGSVETELECPVSVKEGRDFLGEYVSDHTVCQCPQREKGRPTGEDAVMLEEVWFRYEKELPDVVRGAGIHAAAGEMLCVLGGNGTGKTTTLKLIAGLCKPYRGEVKTKGKVCLMPQDPQTLFVKKTVIDEMYDVVGKVTAKTDGRVQNVLKLCRIEELSGRHPYDLSGGEQQRVALAKLLLCEPDVLLLDEPTKGLDAEFKTELAAILNELMLSGVCIVMVSHDVEFAAKYADRCALFFDGSVVAEGVPREFFSGNSFYTTSANRISRGIICDAVTTEDVICAIGGKTLKKEHTEKQASFQTAIKKEKADAEKASKELPLWRRLGAAISVLCAVLIFIFSVKGERLREMIDKNGVTELGKNQLIIYGMLIVLLVLTAVFLGRRSDPSLQVQSPKDKRRLSHRTRLAVALILLIIPLTLFVGVFYIEKKQYYITALAVLIECMLPFFMVFEGRRPRARELVVIAVLCALSIAGRAAFFMLPQFKPVLAMTIIAGVAFGGETGFLVGAVTMLVSNIMFSQGPWTPWQMFAMGIIGFFAGVLYRKGFLRRTKASLCIFGAVTAIVIYGGIMNPASALMWGGEALNFNMIVTYYVTGFPMDCIFAASTSIFLWFAAEPMLEKLDRIKVKYGIIE